VDTSRTERHRADPRKSGGVVYTPTELARFLAHQAFEALGDVSSVRILDPACGDGALLLAAAEAARGRGVLVDTLTGYDTDHKAIRAAARNLEGLKNVRLHCRDFLEASTRGYGRPSLFGENAPDSLEFDLVISNPPYVRTQTLGSSTAQALGRTFGLSGRIDLYQAFAVAMIHALRPLGAIGLLCSNKFLTNRSGQSMRRVLLQEIALTELVDLGDTKLFDAAILPVIVSGRRSERQEVQHLVAFRSVYERKSLPDTPPRTVNSIVDALEGRVAGSVTDGNGTFLIREGTLDPNKDPDLPWTPIDERTRNILHRIESQALPTLGQLGKVRVGVKTTADDVFIRTDWDQLPRYIHPEKELLKPLLTHRDINPWQCAPGSRTILYPHRDRNGRAAPIALREYPRTAAYLKSHQDRLRSRSYVTKAGRSWYEIWVPQSPALWQHQKVVFPDIADVPRFAIDNSGAIVNGDCYWMTIDDPDVAEIVAAVGNSSFCTWFYDAVCGNYLYAGRRRFMTQYIKRLPIPAPTRRVADRIRSLRMNGQFEEVDELVWTLVGLEKIVR
jgi:hypothetical protein